MMKFLRILLIILVTAPVWLYRIVVRPFLPQVCRFHPSCSEYFLQATYLYGPIVGPWRGVKRICRCHPWHPGGFDPP